MRILFLNFLLLLATLLAVPVVHAQSDNVGYYVFDSYDGNDTIYRLVRSAHVQGVENEPSLPGDISVSWDGDDFNCEGEGDQSGGPDCLASVRKNRQLAPNGIGDIINEVSDRIRVVGRRIAWQTVLVFMRSAGAVGIHPAFGSLREVEAISEPSEDDPKECTAEVIGDMGGLLTPEQQAAIASFLNSPAARALWETSGYTEPDIYVGRLEQGGYLLPSGMFMPGQNPTSTACTVQFDGPGSVPAGTIIVHTQPFQNRDPLQVCGSSSFYSNVPSDADVGSVIGTGLSIGLIIDADGIIVFTADYVDASTPDEMHFKGGEDGKCGLDRQP